MQEQLWVARLRTRLESSGTRELSTYSTCPGLYLLTGTRNATRFQILVYGYNPPAHYDEVFRILDERLLPYVVVCAPIPGVRDPMMQYLARHYERVPLGPGRPLLGYDPGILFHRKDAVVAP
jgi:hypothetical protein